MTGCWPRSVPGGVDDFHRVRLVVATNSSDWAAFSVILFGWPFTGMRATPGRRAQTHHHDLAVANAGHIRRGARSATFTTTQNGYSRPERPAAGCSRSYRAQVDSLRGRVRPGAIVQWPSPPEYGDRVVVCNCRYSVWPSCETATPAARIQRHLAVDRGGVVRFRFRPSPSVWPRRSVLAELSSRLRPRSESPLDHVVGAAPSKTRADGSNVIRCK